ncbi:MAG: hypothetical protein S4CHLAM102_14450 [Chlamydiia bacterium]|nr:hypothetical protein [Chlamydiia bacterium]
MSKFNYDDARSKKIEKLHAKYTRSCSREPECPELCKYNETALIDGWTGALVDSLGVKKDKKLISKIRDCWSVTFDQATISENGKVRLEMTLTRTPTLEEVVEFSGLDKDDAKKKYDKFLKEDFNQLAKEIGEARLEALQNCIGKEKGHES